jgi:hypothetical protein
MQNGEATAENILTVPQYSKERVIIQDSNSTPGYILKRIKNRYEHNFYMSVHITIHNIQQAKITQVFTMEYYSGIKKMKY